ncbi:MAG: hypothetical protein A2Y72_00290 [Chloroflexi bacterium RBG_13_53_26]|nr:MAG: hypothetical protein A2Y72_00290 [Chloroflexi bacterium RBG_13_53_26]
MSEMKSAFEKAMERVGGIGEPSKEEMLQWKYVPEGQRLAAGYFKDDINLVAELSKFKEEQKHFVAKGMEEVLLRNITLPLNETAKKNNRKAMEAIKAVKRDKASLENIYTKIRRIFDHHAQQGEQQRKQAYEMLKQDFQLRIQQAMQQGLAPGAKINIESQPQFQEEWRRTVAHLDSQYNTLLDEYKREIQAVR